MKKDKSTETALNYASIFWDKADSQSTLLSQLKTLYEAAAWADIRKSTDLLQELESEIFSIIEELKDLNNDMFDAVRRMKGSIDGEAL